MTESIDAIDQYWEFVPNGNTRGEAQQDIAYLLEAMLHKAGVRLGGRGSNGVVIDALTLALNYVVEKEGFQEKLAERLEEMYSERE